MQDKLGVSNVRFQVSFKGGYVSSPGSFMNGELSIKFISGDENTLTIDGLTIVYKTYMQAGSAERYLIQEIPVTDIEKAMSQIETVEKVDGGYKLKSEETTIPFSFITSRVCSANVIEKTPFGDLTVASVCNVVKAEVVVGGKTVKCHSFFVNSSIGKRHIPGTISAGKDLTFKELPSNIYSYFSPFAVKVTAPEPTVVTKITMTLIQSVHVSVGSLAISKGSNIMASQTLKGHYDVGKEPTTLEINPFIQANSEDIRDFSVEDNLERLLNYEALHVDELVPRTRPRPPPPKAEESIAGSQIIFSRKYTLKIKAKTSNSFRAKVLRFGLSSSQ